MTGDSMTVTLVNVNQTESRELVVQAGGYAEHQFDLVEWSGQSVPLNAREFTVRLGPGAGGKLNIKMRRFVNQPTVAFPWNRNWIRSGLRRQSGLQLNIRDQQLVCSKVRINRTRITRIRRINADKTEKDQRQSALSALSALSAFY
jgi:hypothetical protein